MSRRTYHHGNLRTELLGAARQLLDEGGVDAVTIRKVAKQVGVAHSAPANHFADKQALLTALATELYSELGEIIEKQAGKSEENLRDRLVGLANVMLEFGLAHSNRYRLLWRNDSLDNTDEALNIARERIYEQLTETLAANSNAKSVSRETQAIALWSLLHGYISLRLDGVLIAKMDETKGIKREHAIVDALLQGILS